jgi:hypothetical protein
MKEAVFGAQAHTRLNTAYQYQLPVAGSTKSMILRKGEAYSDKTRLKVV